MGKRYCIAVYLVAIFSTFFACKGINGEGQVDVDSLNQHAYAMRYVNVDSVETISNHVLENNAQDAYALNNLAYVAYQRMDYHKVDSLVSIIRNNSNDQIALLCADVMQMKTTQRTNEGLTFFKAKRQAERRIHRIEQETSDLTPIEHLFYTYAISEMHIISSTYYFYQQQDSLAVAEIEAVRDMNLKDKDPAQWIYYNYMMGPGGLVLDGNEEQRLLKEFDYLVNAYTAARRYEYIYFEANALQSLSTTIQSNGEILYAQRPREIEMLQAQNMSWADDDLPMALCNHAIFLFKQYKDLFQTACALRTCGELCFDREEYEAALDNYAQALHCVNQQHYNYYECTDSLVLYDSVAIDKSMELEWLLDSKVHTVPEWIAGIRLQISKAYSALGNKEASDYNRNSYLDILMHTNQNEEYEDRMQDLQRQTNSMKARLVIALILMLLLFVLVMFYRNKLNIKGRQLKERLKRLENGDEVPKALEQIDEECEELEENLQLSRLRLTANKQHNIEKRAKVSLVHAIIPYLDRIGGEVIRMKRQKHVGDNRREYIVELVDQIEEYNQVLTEWIKMQQGELSLRISTVSLKMLFEIIRNGHYSFDQKGISLNVSDTEAKVKADESLTLFMINTLVDNARKFTPEGGMVSVCSLEHEDYVEIQVSDTGCGLSEEDIDTLNNNKVYDPAEIGKGTASQKGYGFGLMNCRGIIEKYKKHSSLFAHSSFGVRSEVGKGSTFFFRLPRVLCLALTFISITCLGNPTELYDSVYHCNLEERYEEALDIGEEALKQLHPSLVLYDSISNEGCEIAFFTNGDSLDFQTIIGLRNELALAALALNEWGIYEYNNHNFSRLQKLANQDPTLPGYCKKQEEIQRNNHLLLIFIICFTLAVLIAMFRLIIKRQKKEGAGIEQQIADYEQQMEMQRHERKQQIEDGLAKSTYEENRLHVQNQVLDNCLSTIKHESMYYPSRIRQLAINIKDEDIEQLDELVNYYHQIYTLLCRQADSQVEQPGFKRQTLAPSDIIALIEKSCVRINKHNPHECRIQFVGTCDTKMSGDPVLLEVLFDNLLQYMQRDANELVAEITSDNNFVDISLWDNTNSRTEEDLHNMFYPATDRIPLLIAKQVIREHDMYSGNPGLRLIAETKDKGYRIHFTLLRQ